MSEEVECKDPNCSRTFNSTAGMNSHFGHKHNHDNAMIEELRRLADELGDTPSQPEMAEHGKFSPSTYERNFNTWNEAIEEAGLEPNEVEISREELIRDIHRVADDVGNDPSRKVYDEKGKYSPHTVMREFGSWNDGLITAGYNPTSTRDLDDEEIKKYLQNVIDDLGRVPTQREFDEQAPICAYTVRRRFESWVSAIRDLGYEPAEYIPTEEDLFQEIERLHEKHGRITTDIMDDEGGFDSMTYIRRFGSWKNAVIEAGYEEPTVLSGEDHPHWNGGHSDWRGSNWHRVRSKIRQRDDHKCRVCNKPAEYIRGKGHQVHHIKPFASFDNYEEANKHDNLVLLCTSCHRKFEERWTDLDYTEWVDQAREHLDSL